VAPYTLFVERLRRRAAAITGTRHDHQQRVQTLGAGVAAAGALLGVAVGLPDRVIDVDVGQFVGTGQQRRVPGKVDQQPGRDRIELPDMAEVNARKNVPSVDGARTPQNNRDMPPWRSTSMFAIDSAPATMPATSVVTFAPASQPAPPILPAPARSAAPPAPAPPPARGRRPTRDSDHQSARTGPDRHGAKLSGGLAR
jgi:hypothetical protein